MVLLLSTQIQIFKQLILKKKINMLVNGVRALHAKVINYMSGTEAIKLSPKIWQTIYNASKKGSSHNHLLRMESYQKVSYWHQKKYVNDIPNYLSMQKVLRNVKILLFEIRFGAMEVIFTHMVTFLKITKNVFVVWIKRRLNRML